MKKQAVKFGLMNEFDKTKRILGVSGNQKTADSKNVKMDKDKILIEKVGDEIAGVKKEEPMTFEKADSGNVNPDFKEDSPTSRNCSICVTSFKARLDGFNVKAKPDDEENLLMLALSEKTNIAFIDKNTGTFPEYLKPKENYMPRLLSWFDNNLEDKKYYSIEFYWKNSYEGHILIIFKNKGIVTLYDPQDNSTYINKRLETELYKVRRSSIKLINISDCFLNKTVVDSILEARK